MPEKFEPQPEEAHGGEKRSEENFKRMLGEFNKKYKEEDEILASPISGQTPVDLRLTRDVLQKRIEDYKMLLRDLTEGIIEDTDKKVARAAKEEVDRLNGDLAIVEGLIQKKESER